MDDDTPKEENLPSTSKKESQHSSAQDLRNDRARDGRASNSETSVSVTYSNRSRIDMADVRSDVQKCNIYRRQKAAMKKVRGRRGPGRIEKRRRSFTRRQIRRVPRKKMRTKKERKERDPSVSTVFSRLSSRTGSRGQGCLYCGHHCCRRRFDEEGRRLPRRKYGNRKKVTKNGVDKRKPAPKANPPKISDTEKKSNENTGSNDNNGTVPKQT